MKEAINMLTSIQGNPIASYISDASKRGGPALTSELNGLLRVVEEEGEKIAKWPEPQPGAGAELGPLAGAGMYMQYDYDKKKHEQEVSDLLSLIRQAMKR